MLSQTPFQQFLAPRLATARGRLIGMTWRNASEWLEVERTQPTHAHRPVAEVQAGEFESVDKASLPLAWGRKFYQAWWRVKLPANLPGGRLWLKWDDQGEATLYRRDGKGEGMAGWTPHFGIDPGHQQAPLPDNASGELLVESTCCRTGIWVTGEQQGISPEGSLFRGCRLLSRDDDAWHARHDLEVLIGLCDLLYRRADPKPYGPRGAGNDIGMGSGALFNAGGFRTPVESCPPLLRILLRRLTKAVDRLDAEGPAAMREETSAIFKDLPAARHEIKAVLTGHAHIDLAWLWPERVGDFKAVHSFATADTLMGEYPELHFGYSQPASYEAVGRRAPTLLERAKARAKNRGHWEPTGAMYVESDTQLPCGEALVRAIELGQKGFEDLSGEPSRALWLPDVFGYSQVLPQLLSGFGVPYFFTTKMHWSAGTRFPHSAFRWQGLDGKSEVLGFIAWEHYNLAATPRELDWASYNQRQADVFPETLVATGYGDGGGGVSAEMCERARRMNDLADLPRVEWGRIDGFFDRMSEVKADLPAWRGEMYLEYHRGVQTTHVALKQAYRAAERALQFREAANCLAGTGPLDHADWKRVCWAQFHDILPGSSLQEAYEEVVPEMRSIADRNAAAATESLRSGEGEALFNPIPCEVVQAHAGKAVKLPPLAKVAAKDLETFAAEPVRQDGMTLDNGRVRATFNDAGHLVELSVDGEAVALAGPALGLWTFPDVPANYDAWDIDRHTVSAGVACDAPAELTWQGDDARRELVVVRSVANQSKVTLRLILEMASPVLRVEAEVDWRDERTLLKLAVPTQYRTGDAIYGAPFGGTPRGQTGNTIADDARFEVPASRWACVGDGLGGKGVMLVTEATYGMGCRDGLLHASLVRSPLVTEGSSDVPLRDFAGEHYTCTDLGQHTIRLAIGKFDVNASRREQPAQLAETLFSPPVVCAGPSASAGLLSIEGADSVAAAWAKPGEGGAWTLRLHETLGRRGTLKLGLDAGVKATRVDLRGETIGDVPDGALEVGPHELVSIRIERP